MDHTENVVKMAGFNTAAALTGVSDGIPMPVQVALLGKDGKQSLFVIEEKNGQANLLGEQKITALDDDSAGGVLIKDALISLPDGETDALVIDVAFNGPEKRRMQFAQPYRSADHPQGFAVRRLKLLSANGFAGNREQIQAETRRLSKAFIDGMKTHKEGSTLLELQYRAKSKTEVLPPVEKEILFPDEEFQTLLRSPLLVLFLTRGANDKISKKELEALRKLLLNGEKYQNRLFSRVIANIINDLSSMAEERAGSSPPRFEDLIEIRRIIDSRTLPEQGRAFKKALLALGWDIARVSGGFFGFGVKVGKNEKAALAGIAQYLGVQAD